tara:strand:+ start:111 stop:461 length:351 start_codon:yes stop_codon:yes gene_type:complete
MTQVLISSDTLHRMSPEEVEMYLQGSGKPANAPFSELSNVFSWGDSYIPGQQFSRDPRTVESHNRKYSLVYVPKNERPDFNEFSKAKIIAWVYEHFDARYPLTTSKASMVQIAETL